MPFVETVERALGRTAEKIMLPMQPGDVEETFADASLLHALTGFTPQVGVE
jgi:UDP-glucuronate 4-epimerase